MPDHFYTTDPKGELALQAGYKFLGVACYVYSDNVKGTVAVYRCFQASTGDHFYTTDRAEFDNAVKNLGYKAEQIGWYMFDKKVDGSVELKRWYSGSLHDHLYGTQADESKVSNLSAYAPEGVAGYVLNDNGAAQDGTRAVPLYWWCLG